MSGTLRVDNGPTIAIVGAGFSGVATTARLLSEARGPGRIVMINRSGPTARGVAYGTRSEGHVLNVPAGRMSAFPEDEDDFLRFAAGQMAGVTAGSFLPRSLYGAYLDHVLSRAAGSATGTILETAIGEVATIESDRAGHHLRFVDGRVIAADWVVLAVGNYPPMDPSFVDPDFARSARYIGDPWVSGALDRIDPGERVLLLGTGLTMLDVAIGVGGRAGRMTALSRRGIVSTAHRDPGQAPSGDHLPTDLLTGDPTVVDCLRSIRRQVALDRSRGGDWRDVVGALRQITPALWQRLSDRERGRFLRHLRPFWDAHRHRAAPATARALDELRAGGRLVVVAGTVLRIETAANGLTARIRRRGGGEEGVMFDRLVNCTGPASRVALVRDPLIQSLLAANRIRPDRWGLGLETSASLEILGGDGVPAERLFYVGPLLRAQHWEATAVPELRLHARAVARTVAQRAGLQGAAGPVHRAPFGQRGLGSGEAGDRDPVG